MSNSDTWSDRDWPAEARWLDLVSGKTIGVTCVLAGGVAMHAINVYITTTILPSIVADIGGVELYSWTTTLFVVTSILGSALMTAVLERLGARATYVVACATFGWGVMVCAVSPTMPMLLMGRAIQGLGGGLLVSLAYCMIRGVYREGLWPKAFAMVSGMWGVATLLGPAIGGLVAESGQWRAAFWITLPFCGLVGCLAVKVIPRTGSLGDEQGALPVSQLSLLTLIVLVVSIGGLQKTLVGTLASVGISLVLFLGLVRQEKTTVQRLFPRRALEPGSALGATFYMLALLALTVTATEIFVPYFLQVLHRYSPLLAGFMAASMAAGWTVASVLSAGLGQRGRRAALDLGPWISLAGMSMLIFVMPGPLRTDATAHIAIAGGLIAVGFGVGLTWPHLLTMVLKLASPDEQNLASSSITTVQLFATAFGAAVAGMVTNAAGLAEQASLEGTRQAAFWLFAVFAFSPILTLLLKPRATVAR